MLLSSLPLPDARPLPDAGAGAGHDGRPVTVWCSPGAPAPGRTYADAVVDRLHADGHATVVRPAAGLAALADPQSPVPGGVHVLTGGEVSVLDQGLWPDGFTDGLRRLAVAGVLGRSLVVGICFGSQALAEALAPGSVVRSTELRLGLTEAQQPGRAPERVPSFHFERVAPRFAERPGVSARWLGPGALVHAYRAGRGVLGCQFHPELGPDDLPVVAATHPYLLSAFGTAAADVAAQVAQERARWEPDLWDRAVGLPVRAWLGSRARRAAPQASSTSAASTIVYA